MERKFLSWKNNHISKGGRLQLLPILRPTYYMAIYRMPTKVSNIMDQLPINFLWKGNNDGKGLHLVKWDNLLHPLEKGELGLHKLKDRNGALVAKWIWCYNVRKQFFRGWSLIQNTGLPFSTKNRAATPWNSQGSIESHYETFLSDSRQIILHWVMGQIFPSCRTYELEMTLARKFPLIFFFFFFSLSKDGAIKDFWNTEFGFWNLRLR